MSWNCFVVCTSKYLAQECCQFWLKCLWFECVELWHRVLVQVHVQTLVSLLMDNKLLIFFGGHSGILIAKLA